MTAIKRKFQVECRKLAFEQSPHPSIVINAYVTIDQRQLKENHCSRVSRFAKKGR